MQPNTNMKTKEGEKMDEENKDKEIILKIKAKNIDELNQLVEDLKSTVDKTKNFQLKIETTSNKEEITETIKKVNDELNNVKKDEEKTNVKTAVVSIKLGDTEEKLENLTYAQIQGGFEVEELDEIH